VSPAVTWFVEGLLSSQQTLGAIDESGGYKEERREKVTGFQEMGTLRCDGCGEDFFIGHNPASVDRLVAENQAKWLE
jgi:hypothetical protein